MLKHLTINNYILIDSLDMDLNPGFSVMTGETGAGKSIILDALGLLMGQRADTQCIMPGAAKCFVEGVFDVANADLCSLFEENDLDFEPAECILRREISSNGKSRAFVNDTPVNVSILKKISSHLLDIHSQHSNLLLDNSAFQLGIVDTLADHTDVLSQYKESYSRIVEASRKLKELTEDLVKRKNDEDYLRYQLEQLETFNPQQGEDEFLRLQQNELSHAEDIKVALGSIESMLCGDNNDIDGVVDTMNRICQVMRQITHVYPTIEEYLTRLDTVTIEVRDIADDISGKAEDIEYNPERLQKINERLDALYALEQKHRVSSSEDLIVLAENIRSQLTLLTDASDNIHALEEVISSETIIAQKLAAKLSSGRQKAAEMLRKIVEKSLSLMDMPAAKFVVNIQSSTVLNPYGMDKITILFSANNSLAPRSLAEVASGGEMSRVMLALKALTSRQIQLPTIVFDEIDTGVSGKVASSMAQIMGEMCKEAEQQVLAITHLPQIAAKADVHYFVYKEDVDGRTLTRIRELDSEQRITELAHMLSGSKVTDAAMENARQLLQDK
ncbi:MAG: DNA repair protein RecN [Bacteroidaceae bacterium]|nr:DNA repair protein RecN [Bacteroidaceae bacterium]